MRGRDRDISIPAAMKFCRRQTLKQLGKDKGEVMTLKAGKIIFPVAAVFSLLLYTAGPLLAGTETMYDYTKIPPFIEVGVDPNLLLLIDNSASMYDQAYSPENKNYCFAGVDGANSYAAYDETKSYAGYFDPSETSWYNAYDPAMHGSTYDSEWYPVSELVIEAFCTEDLGKKYSNNSLCLVVDETANPKQIKFLAAKGRFLNWLASSKFDVEKEILTGGKYDAASGHLIMESRGCLGHRFIKKIDLKDTANATYYATFGMRQADGNDYSTIIEVFPPTVNGFSFGPCQEAITAWGALDPSSVNLGEMQTKTQACMEAAGTSYITDSQTAFNHVLQECWYFKKFGVWQPGGGTVAGMKNDCEAVYNAPAGSNTYPGSAPDLADYTSPGGLTASDVCNGYYDGYDSSTTPPHWGTGYVGQCWEEEYSQPMIAVACPAGSPVSQATAVKDANDYWYYCDGSNYMRCSKNALPSCNPGTWSVWYEPDPAGTPIPDTVYWTNDNSDAGSLCISYALQKYCLEMDEVTVVDSTEVTDVIGTAWGVPAVMVETAALAQMGDPLLSMAGKVKVVSGTPKGLIQEFKYNLRIGAMQFNPGAYDECTAVARGDGTYRASLYDCLADKGDLIKADSLRDSSQRTAAGSSAISMTATRIRWAWSTPSTTLPPRPGLPWPRPISRRSATMPKRTVSG
jgi:type IV pilus assembly protein PilY1